MKIIIAGCGKIGKSIVESLVKEDHNILVIDNDPEVIAELTNVFDIMGICGNCADSDIVKEANAADADLYMAMTDSDELNMLSCFIAKRMGAKNTVARIRTPEYNDGSLSFMKANLELSMSINPDRLAAHEIFDVLKFPSALKINAFSHRSLEVIEVKLREDSVLDGVQLINIRQMFKSQVLVCCVQRGDEVFIPDGSFVLRAGDKIGITGPHDELQKFFRGAGLFQRQVKNVMILGGGRISHYLAEMLTGRGISVRIIERDAKVCEALGDAIPKAVVIHGDGTQQELLLEEGITNTDAFVSLSGLDETNVMVAMFATMNNVPKAIAKINREELAPMAKKLGLDCIISPRRIVSNIVLSYARALQNSVGSNVETLYKIMDDKAEALEFNVREDAKIVNIPLKDLKLRKNILLMGIIRDRKVITPSGNTMILTGDRVVIITKNQGLRDLSDILAK